LPAGQPEGEQAAEPAGLVKPCLQAVHADAPEEPEKVSAGHAVQFAAEALEYAPGVQKEQTDCPAEEKEPALHALQMDWPATSKNVPAWQSLQPVAAARE